jgi:aminoglycoside phosphotransferase (APT) family kinase protein
MTSQVTAFVSRRWCAPGEGCRVELEPVQGGLESTVLRARISPSTSERAVPSQLVIKQLPAGSTREADVYAVLWRHLERPPAVRVMGQDVSTHATHLYLEHAHPWCSWPWSDARRAAGVCRVLARFHDDERLPRDAFAWDYEQSLARSAQQTLAAAQEARDSGGRRWWRRTGDLRRVVTALPCLRGHLLSGEQTVIHGDVHPGNVILRGPADTDVVLLDWARARLGSPLEDVASWLHSLGCWEPEARRRHDTLLRVYLEARRTHRALSADVRRDCWLASASNGLAGAIRYHLAVLSDEGRAPADRADSKQALAAWARVIKRTAALLTPSRGLRT